MDSRTGRARRAHPRKFSAGVLDQLIAYARAERRLAERTPDGHTEREHLLAAARLGSASARKALAGPGLPREAAYLWGWFEELNAARGGNGFAPNPLSFGEIDAWSRLTRRRLEAWEVRWLTLLDLAWLADPKPAAPKKGKR